MGQQLTQGPGALSQRHTHTTFLSTRIVPPPQESQKVLSDRLGTYAATSPQLVLAKLKYSFFHPEVGVEYFENHMMITHPMCVAKKQIGSKLKSGFANQEEVLGEVRRIQSRSRFLCVSNFAHYQHQHCQEETETASAPF